MVIHTHEIAVLQLKELLLAHVLLDVLVVRHDAFAICSALFLV